MRFGHLGKSDDMFHFEKCITMGFDPPADRLQRTFDGCFLVGRHDKNIFVNLGELVCVVSSKIRKKKFFISMIGFLSKVKCVTIAVVQFGPTIDVERLWCARPRSGKWASWPEPSAGRSWQI